MYKDCNYDICVRSVRGNEVNLELNGTESRLHFHKIKYQITFIEVVVIKIAYIYLNLVPEISHYVIVSHNKRKMSKI